MANSDLQQFLARLKKNRNILKEREAKYAGAAEVKLLNQIDDYGEAIAEVENALKAESPPSVAELEEKFESLILGINVVLVATEAERPLFTGSDDHPPYRGLQKFTEDDHAYFFGRTAAIEELLEKVADLVEAPTSADEPDLIAVLGASGSGKSSLVRAGLIPALGAGEAIPSSNYWPVVVMKPGPRPLEALAQSLVPHLGRGLPAIQDDLKRGPAVLHQLMLEALASQRDEAIFVLVVDQFEELFIQTDETERQAFLNMLLHAAQLSSNRNFIILTMRADFYAWAGQHKALAQAITKHQLLVAPMDERELREAILRPAEVVGLELDKGLEERLVRDTLDQPGSLPLLQHTLLELYNRREEETTQAGQRHARLTTAAYEQIGGVQGALARRADAVLNKLTPDQQDLARDIFLRLTSLGEGAADTRRRVTRTELYPGDVAQAQVDAVLDALADPKSRLVVIDQDSVEVTHEALIQRWDTLQRWLRADRESLKIHRHLTEAATAWKRLKRDPGELYRGARLAQATEWRTERQPRLYPLEEEFLQVSIDTVKAEEANAKQQRDLALSQELLALAQLKSTTDPELSILLTGQALARAETHQGWAALRHYVQHLNLQATLTGHEGEVDSVIFSSDGSRLVTWDNNNTVKVWDAATGQEQFTLIGYEDGVDSVAFSPEGNRLATAASTYNTAKIWDAATGQEQFTLIGYEGGFYFVAFSPDGTRLATVGSDQIIEIWDATTGQELLTLAEHEDAIGWVVFSPDGSRLAAVGSDQTVKIWDVANGQKLFTLAEYEDAINSVVFSPDGTRLATVGSDQTVKIWDVANGHKLSTLVGHERIVISVAFSSNGARLATGSFDQTAKIWDTATGQKLFTLIGHKDQINSVVFSPDGARLATVSSDQTAKIWDTENGQELLTLFGHKDEIMSAVFSLDGTRLATGSLDQTAKIWQLANPDIMSGHKDWIYTIALSPDSSRLATGSGDNTVKIWDVANGQELFTLAGHEDRILFVAFSPDGTRLATESRDNTAKIWDIATGQELLTLAEHEEEIVWVGFGPDSTRLATVSSDQTVKIWDTENGQELLSLAEHEEEIDSVAFSRDSTRLAMVSSDNTIIIWDVTTGQELFSLAGHKDTVVFVVFSSDGSRLVTGSVDNTVKIWNVTSGQELFTLDCHEGEIVSAALSPDGTRLATAMLTKPPKSGMPPPARNCLSWPATKIKFSLSPSARIVPAWPREVMTKPPKSGMSPLVRS